MPTENQDPIKEVEVATPEVKPGTVQIMNNAGFNNPAPMKLKRVLTAIRYTLVSLITAVGATDIFSGGQSKLIVFVLGLIIILTGGIELATGVKPIDDK